MSHPILQTLRDARGAAWHQAKALLDAAEADKRALNAEEQAQFRAISDDLDAKDAQIKDIEKHEQRAQVADATRERIERAAVEEPAAIRAMKAEEADLTAFMKGEKRDFTSELSEPVRRWVGLGPKERRDILTSSTGAPVPTSFYDRLTIHLVQTGPMWQTSTIIRTPGGENIQFPRTTAHGAATFKAEGSALDETNPTFGAFITLGAWKNGTVQQYSYELIADSGVNILDYIAQQAAVSIAVKSGTDFTTGNDSSAPNGIVTASTAGVTGGTGVSGAFTADNLLALLYSVGPQYRQLPGSGWMMRDASILAARQLKDGNGQYLYGPGLNGGEQDRLLGYPLYSNPDVAAAATSAKSVIFGNLPKYTIRQAGAFRFERSDEFAFTSDLITFKWAMRYDGDLIDTTGAIKHFVGGAS